MVWWLVFRRGGLSVHPRIASDADADHESERCDYSGGLREIDGLRVALSILALFALIALLFTGGIPTIQPGAQAMPGTAPT